MKKLKHILIILLSLSVTALYSYPINAVADTIDNIPELRNAGILLLKNNVIQISKNKDANFTPASTTKLITAWLALNNWGEDYHFKTYFFFNEQSHTLWIKGKGDPYLVSEELRLIAKRLKQKGLTKINTVVIDSSVFRKQLSVPGASKTSNPYDAIPSALAANFNTINVARKESGIVSSERQTPLTATARKMAARHSLTSSPVRVNTGFSRQESERYFAELMITFLRQQNIKVSNNIIWDKAPKEKPYYIHINSKSLGDTVRIMLKYSTNFIANQLVLMVATDFYQYPANFEDVERYMHFTLSNYFGWQDFALHEGAGLSHDNYLTPAQLVILLKDFKRWKHLLPKVGHRLYAKSGTLTGVSTLAGYYVDEDQNWNPFALMMKRPVRHARRSQIIRQLVKK